MQKKKKYSNSCVVRKKNSEQNKKLYYHQGQIHKRDSVTGWYIPYINQHLKHCLTDTLLYNKLLRQFSFALSP